MQKGIGDFERIRPCGLGDGLSGSGREGHFLNQPLATVLAQIEEYAVAADLALVQFDRPACKAVQLELTDFPNSAGTAEKKRLVFSKSLELRQTSGIESSLADELGNSCNITLLKCVADAGKKIGGIC